MVWSANASAIDFTFTLPGLAWLAIGVAPTMFPSRPVVGLAGGSGGAGTVSQVDQLASLGNAAGPGVVSRGFFGASSFSQVGGTSILKFQRAWRTGNPADGDVVAGVATPLIFAVGTSNAYVLHASRYAMSIVFVPAGANCTPTTCSGHGTCAEGLCVACTYGYSLPACDACLPGFGAGAGGSGTCYACANNTFSVGGPSAACVACPLGSTSGTASAVCAFAPAVGHAIALPGCQGCSLSFHANATIIDFTFMYTGVAWLGLAVSPSMYPARPVVGLLGATGGGSVVQKDQTTSLATAVGPTVVSRGFMSTSSFSQVGGVSTLHFQRPWNSGVAADGSVVPGVPCSLTVAVGTSNSYTGHSYRGSVSTVLVADGAACTPTTCSSHGVCSGGLCVSCDVGYAGPTCGSCANGFQVSPSGGVRVCSPVTVFNASSMRGPLSLNPEVTVHYKFSGADVSMRLALAGSGAGAWVSVGTSPGARMVGALAHVGEPGAARVRRVRMSSYDASGIVEDTSAPLRDALVSVVGGVTVLQFTEAVDAAAGRRLAGFSAAGDTPVVVAWGRPGVGTLGDHGVTGYASVIVDFATGTLSRAPIPLIQAAHGIGMYIAWGLVLPGGALVALLCRRRAWWYTAHRRAQYAGLVVMLVAFALGLAMVRTHFDTLHKQIGLAAIAGGALQPVGVLLRGRVWWTGRSWTLAHRVVGWGSVAVAVAALVTGVQLVDGNGPLLKLLVAVLATLAAGGVAGVLALAWLARRRAGTAKTFGGIAMTPVIVVLPAARAISERDVALHAHRSDAWIVVDGAVYDVTGYLDQHPGGVAPLLRCAGRDASVPFGGPQHDRAAVLPVLARYRIGVLAAGQGDIAVIKAVAAPPSRRVELEPGHAQEVCTGYDVSSRESLCCETARAPRAGLGATVSVICSARVSKPFAR